jgi:hypothetical protein
MAYFPNAFEKVFVGTSFVVTGKTEDLTAGQFGFFDTKTWTAIPMHATAISNPNVVMVMGNYHNVDKIGTHGGYKESIKSQVINPYNVHRFWKARANPASYQIVVLGWDTVDASTAPKFYCGQTYNLRIDLKGSPVLRTLGRNLYRTFSYTTSCCEDVDTPVAIDPIVVLLEFAKQINDDPLYSDFIATQVFYNSTGVNPDTYVPLTDPADIDAAIGALLLETAYVDTVYGNCSFDPRDYFEAEPLVITSAQLVDDSGDVCPSFEQIVFTELLPAKMPDVSNEMALRDLIMFNNYRQEPYQFNVRRREAEDITAVFAEVSRVAGTSFDFYYILHSADRKYNPSGMHNNDLYLIKLCLPKDTGVGQFESWFGDYLASANTGIFLEDL